MEILKEYSEMIAVKYKKAVITPLLGSWEFFKKPIFSINERDIAQIKKMSCRYNWNTKLNFKTLLSENQITIVITDGLQRILFTSSNFKNVTGYSFQEVKGKKPNFLQGQDTDVEIINKIRTAIGQKKVVKTEVLNYKKNGTPYFCQLEIHPVFNKKNQLQNFVAIEKSSNTK